MRAAENTVTSRKPPFAILALILPLLGTTCVREPVRLSVTGMQGENGEYKNVAVKAEADWVEFRGRNQDGSEALIKVANLNMFAGIDPGKQYDLGATRIYLPDGPVTLLELSRDNSLVAKIGVSVRENGMLLPGLRIRRAERRTLTKDGRRYWTAVQIVLDKGEPVKVLPGVPVEINVEGIVWTMVVTAASVPNPDYKSDQRAEISREEPEFIVDYILYRKQ